MNRGLYQAIKVNPKGPLQLAEAENAVEIARLAGAEHYAADTFQKAVVDLKNAEDYLLSKGKNRKESETNAREAAQMAEDARIITFRKIQEEQLSNERASAAQREADAQGQAKQADDQAKLEQARRMTAEADRRTADQARTEADQARVAAEQAKTQADQANMAAQQSAAQSAALAAREKAAADAAAAQQEASRADAESLRQVAQQAEAEKVQLRERLRQQLNTILETRESARGLIVNINDVLFDFNKYTLKPGAREKLAKVGGILLAYPGLKVQLEGHTDSVGTEDYNMKLSNERAGAVRDYLVSQSVPVANLTAAGFGKASPVASNDTAAGRQQNRRVEMVVSGDPIGVVSQ
jgi:outer membrane protein OmpA-like peptidoglycan-associated protein